MKLVAHYVDPGEASAVSARLREAGVPTEVRSVDPHVIKPSKSGAVHFELWVLFDDQLDDALQLLENPDHVPRQIIATENSKEPGSAEVEGRYDPEKSSFEKLTALIIGVCLLGLIIYTVFGVFSDS